MKPFFLVTREFDLTRFRGQVNYCEKGFPSPPGFVGGGSNSGRSKAHRLRSYESRLNSLAGRVVKQPLPSV